MKALKRIPFLLALCTAVILVFTACGPKGGGNTPTEAPTENTTEEVTTEEVTTKEEAATGYPVPVLTSDTWSNEALNLKMTVPSTWTLYTKEDLSSQYNNGATDPVAGETFYEAVAQMTSGGNNLSISVQNLSGEAEAIQSLGIKDFTSMLISTLQTNLENSGASNLQLEAVDIDFPLDDQACLSASYIYEGTAIRQKMILTLKGDYLYNITITAFDDAGVNDILGFFSKIK